MAQPQQVLGCLPGCVFVIDTFIVPRNIYHAHAACSQPGCLQGEEPG